MAEKNRVEMVIDQKQIALLGDESEEYMRSIGAYLNSRIQELRQSPAMQALTADLFYLLLAVNLTDDYYKLRSENTRLEEMTRLQQEDLRRLGTRTEELEALLATGDESPQIETAAETGKLLQDEPNTETEALPQDELNAETESSPQDMTSPETDASPQDEPSPETEMPAYAETNTETIAPPTQLKPAADMDLGRRYAEQAARITALTAEKEDLKQKLAQLKALIGQLESRERPVDQVELQEENMALRRENDALREQLEQREEENG